MNTLESCRPDLVNLPHIALPFYVRSTGHWRLEEKESNFTSGVKSISPELLWCSEGAGEITINGRKFPFVAGDFVYLLPGEDREYHAGACGMRWYWLAFDGPLADAVLLSCRLPRRVAGGICPVTLFAELAELVSSSQAENVASSDAILMKILMLAAGTYSRQPSHETRLERCVQFMRRNFSNPELDLNYLSDHFQLPRSSLSKLFREQLRRSPGRFLRNCRFAHALTMLHDGTLSIAEVARECGYRDAVTFSRMFHRAYGKSPSEFRANLEHSPADENSVEKKTRTDVDIIEDNGDSNNRG